MESSPFRKVPAEVRNYIYELVFTKPGPVNFICKRQCLVWSKRVYGPPTIGFDCDDAASAQDLLALAQTCKQIRVECERLAFTCTSLRLYLADLLERKLPNKRFCDDMIQIFDMFESQVGQDKLELVKSITIHLGNLQSNYIRHTEYICQYRHLLALSALYPSYRMSFELTLPPDCEGDFIKEGISFRIDMHSQGPSIRRALESVRLILDGYYPMEASVQDLLDKHDQRQELETWLRLAL